MIRFSNLVLATKKTGTLCVPGKNALYSATPIPYVIF